ncbi:ATP-citrate synthase alpha chain protein 2-like isoform X2 [Lolium rigidum]|uniref:ATP-citrate synthase alpha chain protein 2-like isoform X2 n=1 Tax=Lolium rigidum TaxID=89674 RepID=UPI001F5CD282|nr:ATP-citrate synthase alpha chain protein 2-like isoform X2 [Lolium rigidum]
MEMNPLILVNGEAYPVDIGELDDTIAFKYLKKWSSLEFPLPFGRVMSLFQKGYIYELDEKNSRSPRPKRREPTRKMKIPMRARSGLALTLAALT